jgi:hypothetical protein
VTGGGETASATPGAGWRFPLLVHAAVLAVLLLVSWQTISQVVENPKGLPGFGFAGDGFWGGWLRFDGGWYVLIADRGYSYAEGQQSSVAFFPAYPLLVRGIGRSVGNVPLGGILATIACGFGASASYWRWCTARLPRPEAVGAFLALLLYPYAWYLYGAVYGDALFLLAVVGAFLLLDRGHPVLAGLVGLVATSARLVGVALVVGLLVGVLEQRGAFSGTRWGFLPRKVDIRRLRRADAGVLLAPLGLVAWMAWLWHRFGDPLLFSSVQEYWGQPSTPRTWFKIDLLAALHGSPDRLYAYGCLVQGLLALLVLLLIPAVSRRFGLRYGAYQAVLVAIPTFGSQDFQGTGRYLIAAFPAFAIVGSHLAQHPARARIAAPISAALLVLGTAWFAHGLYLS